MSEIGIRALQQNASAVVAEAAAGEIVTITDRGRPVARLVPIRESRLQELIDAGRAQPAKGSLADLPPPEPGSPGGPSLTEVLLQMRDEERY
jgi:prevent-host-death family protein